MAGAGHPAGLGVLDGGCRYKKLRDINHGAFGFVILAEDQTTQEQVALKFIERGPQVGAAGARWRARVRAVLAERQPAAPGVRAGCCVEGAL